MQLVINFTRMLTVFLYVVFRGKVGANADYQ
jgi:hypothetical protein